MLFYKGKAGRDGRDGPAGPPGTPGIPGIQRGTIIINILLARVDECEKNELIK